MECQLGKPYRVCPRGSLLIRSSFLQEEGCSLAPDWKRVEPKEPMGGANKVKIDTTRPCYIYGAFLSTAAGYKLCPAIISLPAGPLYETKPAPTDWSSWTSPRRPGVSRTLFSWSNCYSPAARQRPGPK